MINFTVNGRSSVGGGARNKRSIHLCQGKWTALWRSRWTFWQRHLSQERPLQHHKVRALRVRRTPGLQREVPGFLRSWRGARPDFHYGFLMRKVNTGIFTGGVITVPAEEKWCYGGQKLLVSLRVYFFGSRKTGKINETKKFQEAAGIKGTVDHSCLVRGHADIWSAGRLFSFILLESANVHSRRKWFTQRWKYVLNGQWL